MNQFDFSLFTLGGSLLAGLLGSLTGLGGGVVLVPMLVLLFKVDIHYAIGASLISVIPRLLARPLPTCARGIPTFASACFLRLRPPWEQSGAPGWQLALQHGVLLLYLAWSCCIRSTFHPVNMTAPSSLPIAGLHDLR